MIICLGTCCTGLEFFSKGNEFYSFSVFGVEKGNQTDLHTKFTYLTVIGLCLFTFMTLMSYKN